MLVSTDLRALSHRHVQFLGIIANTSIAALSQSSNERAAAVLCRGGAGSGGLWSCEPGRARCGLFSNLLLRYYCESCYKEFLWPAGKFKAVQAKHELVSAGRDDESILKLTAQYTMPSAPVNGTLKVTVVTADLKGLCVSLRRRLSTAGEEECLPASAGDEGLRGCSPNCKARVLLLHPIPGIPLMRIKTRRDPTPRDTVRGTPRERERDHLYWYTKLV